MKEGKMAYQAPKGTKDLLPQDSYKWQYLEELIRRITRKYGFLEARTPIIEHTELFLRGIGDTTDVVQKEMYTFLDKGDRSITLRPEGTAGFARLYNEHALFNEPQPIKMYYLSAPVFRYERPQAGRLREHHQFGVEYYGSSRPSADAEVILLALEILKKAGCSDLKVCINNIGCEECRPKYQNALRAYFSEHIDELCPTCRDRLERNPLRILDCKTPHCRELAQGAPVITDFVCDRCREHFDELKKLLLEAGVYFEVVPTIVRGLDYYTRTVFEIVSDAPGSEGTICGGGRYDHLVEELGGPSVPAIGFGLGMERLLLAIESSGRMISAPEPCSLFIVSIGEKAFSRAFHLCRQLRDEGLFAECDQIGRSAKAQFKYADKIRARYVLTIGENELTGGKAVLRCLENGSERPVDLEARSIMSCLCEEDRDE